MRRGLSVILSALATLSGGAVVGELRLVSGTRADGVWRGTITLTAGTRGPWRLVVDLSDRWNNRWNNRTRLTTEDLAAPGFPTAVHSQTTRAPARPSLTGRSGVFFGIPPSPPVRIIGSVQWMPPTGTPAVSGVQLDSADAACDTSPQKYGETRTVVFPDRTIVLPCTVQLRVVNGAGGSPPASVTFW